MRVRTIKATLSERQWRWLLSPVLHCYIATLLPSLQWCHISRALLRRWWWLLTKYSHVSLSRPSWLGPIPAPIIQISTPVLSTLFSTLNVMPTLRFQLREPLNRNPNLVQMQHFFQLNIDVPLKHHFMLGGEMFCISGCWTENEGSDEMTTIFRPRQCSQGNPNTMQKELNP